MVRSNYVCRVNYEVTKQGILGLGEPIEEEVYRDCYKNMAIFSVDKEYPINLTGVSGTFLESNLELINMIATEDREICILNEQKECYEELKFKEGYVLSGWICFMNENNSDYFCEFLTSDDTNYSLLEVESIELI